VRDYVRLSGILFIITAVVAFVLSIANSATNERINSLAKAAVKSAQSEVLKGAGDIELDTAQTFEYKTDNSSVSSITKYQKTDGGSLFAVSCTPKGYGGEISMMVGVDDNLTIIGINIIDNAKETPGLGSEIGKSEFYNQFGGKTPNITITKGKPSDNEIQAVTGATVSSKAVVNGVNDAIAAVQEVLST